MIIGTDVSFWEDDSETTRHIDFVKMKTAGAKFTIIKSSQNLWIDRDFYLNRFNAKAAELYWGAYHFYDSRAEPVAQANKWFNILQGDYGDLPLFADFEDEYNGAYGNGENLKIFLERIKELIPNKEIIIYSGYWYWKDHISTSLHDYFKQFDLWLAAYDTIAPKIPLPWTKWTFWQWTDKGSGTIYGTEGSVDLNYFNGDEAEFIKRFDLTNVPPTPFGDTLLFERKYYDGAIYRKYETHLPVSGWTPYHVLEFDSDKTELFISPRPLGNNYVPHLTKKYSLNFGMNCDGFIGNDIAGYAVSNGQPYGIPGMEQTLYISKENNFTLTRPAILHMAFSYPNVIVKDGAIPYIDKGDDWRARSAFGYTKDQKKFFFVTIDGQDYLESVGASFKETAKIMLNLGCDFAVMCDGGGSTTLAAMESGVAILLNKSWGEESIAGYPYKMRPVAQIIGVKMKGESLPPPPIGDFMYEVTKTIGERPTASMYNTSGVPVFAGYKFDSLTTVTNYNLLKPSDWGVTFVQLPSGGWLPMVYKGTIYVKTISPPANEFVSATLIRTDGTTVEFVPKV